LGSSRKKSKAFSVYSKDRVVYEDKLPYQTPSAVLTSPI